ncbi:MAG: TldD/PmbA family protein, partial [Polyangiales bacterium]
MTGRYHAPFAEHGSHAIDADIANRLLRIALGKGGDYADLFFEYSVSGSYAYDEQILRSARRAVSMGLGVRVMKGDATGYAYCEELSFEAMKRAAETAAQIAAGGKPHSPVGVTLRELPDRYPIAVESIDVDGAAKKAILERADRAARAADSRVIRVDASLAEGVREILVANSLGHMARDRQPMMRFGVRVIAQDGDNRQSGSSGGGGRLGLEYFDDRAPEWHAEQAVKQALVMLDAREAPAGEMDVVLGPGDSGILLHEAVGHGLEADFNRKNTSNYSNRIGEEVASALCTVVDDASLPGSRGSINVDDEGLLPTRSVLIEDGVLRGY